MCGIIGYLRRRPAPDDPPVGTVVLGMLRALGARGPDSAGAAMFGAAAGADGLRLRIGLGENGTGAAQEAAILAEVGRLTAVRSAARFGETLRVEVEPAAPEALEAAVLRAAPGAEVFSIGRGLELMKQVGAPEALERQFGIGGMGGTHALGHTRLSTESRVDISHSQPFWTHGVPDMAVVHNGHVTNYHRLRRRLEASGTRFYTENDSEIIGPYLRAQMEAGRTIEEAMEASTRDLDGTFCYLVATAEGLGMAKDFFCSKPLVLVETPEYVAVATEETAIRRAFPDAPDPVEPGANAVHFWHVDGN